MPAAVRRRSCRARTGRRCRRRRRTGRAGEGEGHEYGGHTQQPDRHRGGAVEDLKLCLHFAIPGLAGLPQSREQDVLDAEHDVGDQPREGGDAQDEEAVLGQFPPMRLGLARILRRGQEHPGPRARDGQSRAERANRGMGRRPGHRVAAHDEPSDHLDDDGGDDSDEEADGDGAEHSDGADRRLDRGFRLARGRVRWNRHRWGRTGRRSGRRWRRSPRRPLSSDDDSKTSRQIDNCVNVQCSHGTRLELPCGQG